MKVSLPYVRLKHFSKLTSLGSSSFEGFPDCFQYFHGSGSPIDLLFPTDFRQRNREDLEKAAVNVHRKGTNGVIFIRREPYNV